MPTWTTITGAASTRAGAHETERVIVKFLFSVSSRRLCLKSMGYPITSRSILRVTILMWCAHCGILPNVRDIYPLKRAEHLILQSSGQLDADISRYRYKK